MRKFTPGPWKFREDNKCVVDATNTLVSISGIAQPHGYISDDDESFHNARLIAAAPDLLEALRPFAAAWNADRPGRSWGGVSPDHYRRAFEVFNKAEGRDA